MNQHLIEKLASIIPSMTQFRRDLHAHPELCFQEYRTSQRIVDQLQQWGIEVHTGIAETGVVGVIRKGSSSRSIGLRADMDALPMTEQNQFQHVSQYSGRMHACGHDGHVAMLLTAAYFLATQSEFDGTVNLIFQPAEEGGGGARRMLEEGLFERFPMDQIYAMHNWPGITEGQVAVCDGPIMASSNEFRILIKGKGGHAALPHLGIDPIPIACQLVQAFQTILTRNKNPSESGVISVTMIHAGEATNVVPEECELRGTVRTFTYELLDLIESRMRELTQHIANAYGAEPQFVFTRNYPPTINHAEAVVKIRAAAANLWGSGGAQNFVPTMGAEDFSFFLQKKQGAYFMIGNGDGSHRQQGHGLGPCQLHNPSYDFNDNLIAKGAAFWVALVNTALNH